MKSHHNLHSIASVACDSVSAPNHIIPPHVASRRAACSNAMLGSAMLVFGLLTGTARAELLIYEGFNGYVDGTLRGQTVSTHSIGLRAESAWGSSNSNATTGINIQSTGLTFSNLAVSGGSAFQKSSSGTHSGAYLSDSLATYSGTLYGSYLIQFSTSPSTDKTPYAIVDIAASPTDVTTRRFASAADNSGSSNNTLAVGYDGPAANATNSSISLPAGATYIVLARFTNVGVQLDADTTGMATQWVLSETQFDYFKATSFAGLETATIGSGTTNVICTVSDDAVTSGTYSLTGALQLSMNANSSSRTFTIDEIRFGTSLNDVTPLVPEPRTMALLIGCAATAFVCLRRFGFR
ncbi:hypothetical protein Ga0100231_012850 [Opitutaceae bacterium TAV4]|uniref:hypothetical protein n=1 Tax=Geminisphaera colitermitum TaxID=1148786 RepID=UPI0001964EE4|nr:hypothetical protein [Geminisphaera colitermitum]RRJ95065.1 hypothetical protein Ga0100231_012850 [Opitutaceae bacterium TAV4]RRJ99321.1 hypothetical protein Ga0100230_014140 [Opitutaceae bacterium TAV3]